MAQLGNIVHKSELITVHDVIGPKVFDVEVKTPSGETKTFTNVKKYTESLSISQNGEVSLRVVSKTHKPVTVLSPDYFMINNVLCCMKQYKLNKTNSFGMNYEIFRANWDVCFLLYLPKKNSPDEQEVLIATRDEWDKNGVLAHHGEEMQMFLEVNSRTALRLGKEGSLVSDRIRDWIRQCVKKTLR